MIAVNSKLSRGSNSSRTLNDWLGVTSTHENPSTHRFSKDRRFPEEPDRSPGPWYYHPNHSFVLGSTPSSRNQLSSPMIANSKISDSTPKVKDMVYRIYKYL